MGARSVVVQPDTALSTEDNLAKAARRRPRAQDVTFQTVCDQASILVERSGTPEANVTEWIGRCVG